MGRRVLLIEDHQLLAQSLAAHLRSAGVTPVLVDVARATDDEILARGSRADVVLLDLELGPGPDGRVRDGAQLVAPLKRLGTAVVVVTGSAEPARWGRCLADGAVTVVLKTESVGATLDVVRRLAAGRPIDPPPWREEALRAWQTYRHERARLVAPLLELTPREAQVLELLADGVTVTGIAVRDVVSEATVRSQIKSILQKLDVSSQLQAVALLHQAQQVGWRRQGSPGPGHGPTRRRARQSTD